MSMLERGRPFHGEFSSADASALDEANSRFNLYPAGNTSGITLTAAQQVVVTDVFVLAGAALTVTLYDGGDDTVGAGERILLANMAANGGSNGPMHIPHYCQVGTYPKVKTGGAGQIDATIRGVILG